MNIILFFACLTIAVWVLWLWGTAGLWAWAMIAGVSLVLIIIEVIKAVRN